MNKFEQIHVMGGSPCGRGRDPKWRGEVAVVHTFIDNRVVGLQLKGFLVINKLSL